MNNSERFYFETDVAIKVMNAFLNSDSKNHEYQAKKVIKILKECKIDVESFRFSFASLISIASFALNKEKIENQGDIIWDNYKSEMTSKIKNFSGRFSYIDYFKEWYQVRGCAEKYLKQNSKFWIKKIRDAFLHGQFELEYAKKQNMPLSEIKIFQGTKTKTDVDISLYEPGLTEFVEDNFRNIYNHGYGIKEVYSFLRYPDIEITNLETLEEFLKRTTRTDYKIDFENYTYDGMTLNSKDGTKKIKPTIKTFQHVDNPVEGPKIPEYMVQVGEPLALTPKNASLLARMIDKKSGYIYSSGKKRKVIHQYISNYFMNNETINSLLHEFTNAANYIYFNVYSKVKSPLDYGRTFYIINSLKENILPAFTLLQLYRLSYRLQNKNFEPVDYSKLECEKLFNCPTQEFLDDKKEKLKKKFPDLTEKEITNKAYLEVLRDALAHGNVEIQTHSSDDLTVVDRIFTFTDSWTDKAGNHTDTILRSNSKCLQELFRSIDKEMSFMSYVNDSTID